MERSELVRLASGRQLEVNFYGERGGESVMYCHGIPSAGREAQIADTEASATGIALIAPCRPGIGHSTHVPSRRVVDCSRDIEHLADALGVDRFSVLGVSGGGPHALACARQLHSRLNTVAVVSGLAPSSAAGVNQDMTLFNRLFLSLSRYFPTLADVMVWRLIHKFRRDWRGCIDTLMQGNPPCDQEFFQDPDMLEYRRDCLIDAVRQGTRGVVADLLAVTRPWGFRLEEIPMKVHLWHGLDDRSVPPSATRYVTSKIPETEVEYLPGEGHFMVFSHMREIFEKMKAACG